MNRDVDDWRAAEPTRFTNLRDALSILQALDIEPETGAEVDKFILPIENPSISYEMTVTHVPSAHAVYLGAKVATVPELPLGFARDLLTENQFVSNAKLSIVQPEPRESQYEIVASYEIRTPFLSNEGLIDNLRAFDSAVTFEYGQVSALAEKNGVHLIEGPVTLPPVQLGTWDAP